MPLSAIFQLYHGRCRGRDRIIVELGSHGYDDMIKSMLVDDCEFHKKHIKTLLSHSNIIVTITTMAAILDFS